MFHRTYKLFSGKTLKTCSRHCCWIFNTRQASLQHNDPSCINYLHGKLLSRKTPIISNWQAFSLSRHPEAKNRNEDSKHPKIDVFDQYDNTLSSSSKLSMAEWEGIATAGVAAGLTSQVCDALILKKCLGACNYSLGSSYMEFVEQHQRREPTAGCLALYMDLCTLGYQECGELPILSAYERLSSRLPAFPTTLAVRAVLALCRTSRWREGLSHLEAIDRRGDNMPKGVLAALSRAAFESGDGAIGWQMLEKLCRKRYNALADLLKAFDHYCSTLDEENSEAAVQRLLRLVGEWQVYPDAASSQQLVEGLCGRGWAVSDTSIGDAGHCKRCGERLKHEHIPENRFLQLREDILERVLKREDIFQVTSPEEFKKFSELMESRGPFTHILDGLNIAFARSTTGRQRPGIKRNEARHLEHSRAMAENVLKIIDDIIQENPNSKVLVIGRDHMRRWHRPTMMQVHIKATVFYLQNVTLDDSYFLYAALHSGPDTKIVTNDLLRNHQFRLGTDDEQQRVFRLWKQRVQQTIALYPLSLQPPAPFTVAAQPSDSGQRWHLPYDDGSLEFSYQLPETWLCFAKRGLAAEQAPSATEQPDAVFEPKKYPGMSQSSAGGTRAKDINRNARLVIEKGDDSSYPREFSRDKDQMTNTKKNYVNRKPKLNIDISKFFPS